jgi:replicative DNA helicase
MEPNLQLQLELDLLGALYSPGPVKHAIERIEAYESYMFSALSPDDFTDKRCAAVFQAFQEARASGSDSETLIILRDRGLIRRPIADWIEFLQDVRERYVNPATMMWLTRSVYRASRLRRVKEQLAALGEELPEINLAMLGQNGGLLNLPDIRGKAAELLASIEPPEFNRSFADDVNDVISASVEERMPAQIKLGIHPIDADTVLLPGHLMIVGASPHAGKTIFSGQVCLNLALRGERSLFLTGEVKRHEIIERLTCNLSNQDIYALRGVGKVDSVKRDIQNAGEILKALPIQIEQTYTLKSVEDALLREARLGTRLVVIDYLQKIRDMKIYRDRSRHEEVALVAETLKQLALEHGVAIIATSQFNREATKDNVEPRMSHLRESGAIEQEADHILLLWRKQEGVFYRIAKNRHGRIADQWSPLDIDYPLFRIGAGNYGCAGAQSEDIYP